MSRRSSGSSASRRPCRHRRVLSGVSWREPSTAGSCRRSATRVRTSRIAIRARPADRVPPQRRPPVAAQPGRTGCAGRRVGIRVNPCAGATLHGGTRARTRAPSPRSPASTTSACRTRSRSLARFRLTIDTVHVHSRGTLLRRLARRGGRGHAPAPPRRRQARGRVPGQGGEHRWRARCAVPSGRRSVGPRRLGGILATHFGPLGVVVANLLGEFIAKQTGCTWRR